MFEAIKRRLRKEQVYLFDPPLLVYLDIVDPRDDTGHGGIWVCEDQIDYEYMQSYVELLDVQGYDIRADFL